MSPAKRLSRKRFRALCERCAKWADFRASIREADRVSGYLAHLMNTTHRRSDDVDPWIGAWLQVRNHARLAR